MSRASVETLRVFGERIFYIGLGEGKLGPGFPVPGNWMSLAGLRGIRFLMFRPGLANPAFPDRPDADIRAFPVEAADFRETFRSLDLEVRFQLVTENDELRRRAVTAVDEGLEELRKATAAYR
jgi:hypothetical protein